MTNLFCFPYSGANKYSYYEFEKNVSRDVKIITVELPGRGSRSHEKLFTDLQAISDDIFAQYKTELAAPYAIYGHSMGTILAYEFTKRVVKHKLPQPLHVFLSGRAGPSIPYKEIFYNLWPRSKFVEKLRGLGGFSEDLLQDSNFMDYLEPIIRADFQAIETYTYTRSGPFEVPVTVFLGESEDIGYEDSEKWAEITTGPFRIISFPGNHFFIFTNTKEIFGVINQSLTSIAV